MPLLDFRLHYEGNNRNPNWGIAFRHDNDVSLAIDDDPARRPGQIAMEFPNGALYIFHIRESFWPKPSGKRPCREFVDAAETTKTYPVKRWAIDGLVSCPRNSLT
jgi:hypothetical protein